MRASFHAELDELRTELARMARLAGQMMTNASIALHQTDLALAEVVIADSDQMNGMLDDTERRCIILLALQAPVAGDLRVVVAALHAVGHLKRMDSLARHIAVVARLKRPNPMVSGKVRPVLARMSLLASQLAEDAAIAIEHRDPLSGCWLTVADNEVDALLRHLFAILFADDCSHTVEQAVDAALIGRYYERFGDHAVTIAQRFRSVATGQTPEPTAVGTAPQPQPLLTMTKDRNPRLRPRWDTYGQVIEADGVVFDGLRRRVLVDGYVVHLRAREAAVLGVLMVHPGQLVYNPALVNAGWGTQRAHHSAVDRLMRRLRRRLEPSPVSPARLRRVGDTGYIFGSMS